MSGSTTRSARTALGPLPTSLVVATLALLGAALVAGGAPSTPWWAMAGLAGGYAISGSV